MSNEIKRVEGYEVGKEYTHINDCGLYLYVGVDRKERPVFRTPDGVIWTWPKSYDDVHEYIGDKADPVEFSIYDVVRLKSGGPNMLIEKIEWRYGWSASEVVCEWLDGSRKNVFRPSSLVKVKPLHGTRKDVYPVDEYVIGRFYTHTDSSEANPDYVSTEYVGLSDPDRKPCFRLADRETITCWDGDLNAHDFIGERMP